MAAIAQVTPYLNRMVTLVKQNASAKLEIHCKSGLLSVNFSHEIGSVEETLSKTSSTYSDVLKSNSKLKRLKKELQKGLRKPTTKLMGLKKQPMLLWMLKLRHHVRLNKPIARTLS